MPIAYCRTLAMYIALLMKVRRKKTPMDQPLTDKTEGALTPGLVCHMEEALARSRKLLQETATVCQERRAARKRQAELPASSRRKRVS